MKMVDKLEDQLAEEKTRLMAMLEYVNRSDLEMDSLPPLGSLPNTKALTLAERSPARSPDQFEEAKGPLRRPSQTYASLIREVGACYRSL